MLDPHVERLQWSEDVPGSCENLEGSDMVPAKPRRTLPCKLWHPRAQKQIFEECLDPE